jgi:transposase
VGPGVRGFGQGPRQRIPDDRHHDRARPSARGGRKRGAPDRQALGRSRGGLSTKIHALVDALGRIVDVALTPGQAADIVAAHALLDGRSFRGLIADRAYDADHLTVPLREQGVNIVIPSTRSRRLAVPHDVAAYKRRNLIERFFCKLKRFRGIATRYDKTARNFRDATLLAAALSSLN